MDKEKIKMVELKDNDYAELKYIFNSIPGLPYWQSNIEVVKSIIDPLTGFTESIERYTVFATDVKKYVYSKLPAKDMRFAPTFNGRFIFCKVGPTRDLIVDFIINEIKHIKPKHIEQTVYKAIESVPKKQTNIKAIS